MLFKLYRSSVITFIQQFFFIKRWHVIIFLCFCLTATTSLAQRTKIDSLKKILHSLHDTARVNCLNELSTYYCNYHSTTPHYSRTDSAELCANDAYSEAVKLNYKLGIADAILNLGEIYTVRYDFFTAQKYLEKAIALFKEIKNEFYLIQAYMSLIDVLFYECDIPSIRNKIQIPLRYYKNIHDSFAEAGVWGYLWECDIWEGHSEKAFESLQTDFNLIKNLSDPTSVLDVLYRKEQLYRMAEWFDSAASYSVKIIAYKKKLGLDTVGIGDKGFKYFMEGKWDSAQYYNKQTHNLIISYKGIDSIVKKRMILRNDIDIASLDQRLGKYQEALPIFMKSLQFDKERNIVSEELEVLLNISQIYKLEGKNNDAIHYLENLLSLAQKTGAIYYIQNVYEQLWKIYDKKKDSANAYKYYVKYTALKDSTITSTYQRKLAVINELTKEREQQTQIAVLDRDNKLKQVAIQKNILFRNILLSGIALLILLAFIVYRFINLKRKNEKLEKATLQNSLDIERIQNEKKQSELQNKATDLEMQALRAQMNPHFIFNCLNSINRFIIRNNAAQAADYLTKFAKLIRIILQQSGKSFIPLEDELYYLQLYMDLEALRFEIPFSYEINCNGINKSLVMIPSLLIQPFVENAIWHGLQGNGNNKGKIDIDMHVDDNILHCKICDNGIGKASIAIKKKAGIGKKSLGINLTQHRLQLIDSPKQHELGIEILDLINEDGYSSGTCVYIKIPVQQLM